MTEEEEKEKSKKMAEGKREEFRSTHRQDVVTALFVVHHFYARRRPY